MTFEDQVLTKLNLIESKLDLIEDRHAAVSERLARVEVKLETLEPNKPASLARDSGLTLSSGAVGAAIAAIVQHFAAK